MNSIVDQIFVINMDKDKDRLAIFDDTMKKSNWEYTRISAVEGKKLTPKNHLLNKYTKKIAWLKKGEIGCLLSHVIIWEKLLNDKNLNRILIFEDDARTHMASEDVSKLLQDFYSHISTSGTPEPDMLYLGKALDFCMNYEKVWGNVYKSVRALCLHAYIITKNGAKNLLSLAPYNRPIDLIPPLAVKKKLINVMVFHPSIYFQDIFGLKAGETVLQKGSTSNLRGIKSAFNNITECSTQVYSTEESWTIIVMVVLGLIIFAILCILYFTS